MLISKMLKGAISAVTLAGTLAISTAAWAETTITMNVWFPRMVYFYTDYMQAWADEVEAKSNGDIKVVVPAQSMAPPPGQMQLLLDGGADVVMIINAYHGDKLMLPMIGALPFMAETEEGAHVALWRTYKEYFETAGEYRGMKVLGMTMPAGNGFQSAGGPVRSIDDLKGLKVRTDPGPMGGFFEKAGSTIVVRPGNESFEMMSGGVVDANLMPLDGAVTLGYGKFLKSITQVPGGLGRFVFTFAMSQEKWDSLTPEQQKIVEEAAGEELGRRLGQKLDAMNKGMSAQLQADGVHVELASPEFTAELQTALAFVREGWAMGAKAKGIDADAALAYFAKVAANPN